MDILNPVYQFRILLGPVAVLIIQMIFEKPMSFLIDGTY